MTSSVLSNTLEVMHRFDDVLHNSFSTVRYQNKREGFIPWELDLNYITHDIIAAASPRSSYSTDTSQFNSLDNIRNGVNERKYSFTTFLSAEIPRDAAPLNYNEIGRLDHFFLCNTEFNLIGYNISGECKPSLSYNTMIDDKTVAISMEATSCDIDGIEMVHEKEEDFIHHTLADNLPTGCQYHSGEKTLVDQPKIAPKRSLIEPLWKITKHNRRNKGNKYKNMQFLESITTGPLHERDTSIESPRPQSPPFSLDRLLDMKSSKTNVRSGKKHKTEFDCIKLNKNWNTRNFDFKMLGEYQESNIIGIPIQQEMNNLRSLMNKTESINQRSYFPIPKNITKHKNIIPSKMFGNCPELLSTFLTRHHFSHFLLFNFSSVNPDSRTQLLLNNQVCTIPWICPASTSCMESHSFTMNGVRDEKNKFSFISVTSIPTLSCLLSICYAIRSYTSIHPTNVAVLTCQNGITRTGIATAAYLKYTSRATSSLQAFRMFFSRRCADLVTSEQIDKSIPPGLKSLFTNFDSLIECRGCIRKNGSILRAVTLQGVPHEDMPRVEIWDGRRLVYSSHEIDGNKNDNIVGKVVTEVTIATEVSIIFNYNNVMDRGKRSRRNWGVIKCQKQLFLINEEGFYHINKPLNGDFLLLCRFGNEYAHDTCDPTKVNSMRRYANSFDEGEFLPTLLFDRVGIEELHDKQEMYVTNNTILEESSADFLEGKISLERGCKILSNAHCLASLTQNKLTVILPAIHYFIEGIIKFILNLVAKKNGRKIVSKYLYEDWPDQIPKMLAIQLCNSNISAACQIILEGRIQMFLSVYYPELTSVKKDFYQTVYILINNNPSVMYDNILKDQSKFLILSNMFSRNINLLKKNHESLNKYIFRQVEWKGFCLFQYSFFFLSLLKKNLLLDTHRLYNFPVKAWSSNTLESNFRDIHLFLILESLYNAQICEYDGYNKVHIVLSLLYIYHKPLIQPLKSVISPDHISITDDDWGDKTPLDFLFYASENKSQRSFEEETNISVQVLPDKYIYSKIVHKYNRLFLNDPLIASMNTMELVGTIERAEEIMENANQNYFTHILIQHWNLMTLFAEHVTWVLQIPNNNQFTSNVLPFFTNEISRNLSINLFVYQCGQIGVYTKSLLYLNIGNTFLRRTPNFLNLSIQFDEKKLILAAISWLRSGYHINGMVPYVDTSAIIFSCRKKEHVNYDLIKYIISFVKNITRDCGYNRNILVQILDNTSLNIQSLIAQKIEFLVARFLPMPQLLLRKYNVILQEEYISTQVSSCRCEIQAGGYVTAAMTKCKKQKLLTLENDTQYVKLFVMINNTINASQKDRKYFKSMNDYISKLKLAPNWRKDESKLPIYSKMFRVLHPFKSIRHSIKVSGKMFMLVDKDNEKDLKSQSQPVKSYRHNLYEKPKLKNSQKIKYFDMIKRSIPIESVKLPDGRDPVITDFDTDRPIHFQLKEVEYAKYFKMLKMGLPIDAVKNCMQRDGKDPSIMNLDPDKSLNSQINKNDEPYLKDNPEYTKYFKMLKMGLPIDAVKNCMQRDGKDPSIIDLMPATLAVSQRRKNKNILTTNKERKPKVRRKKIFWNAMDTSAIRRNSIWSKIQGMVDMEKLKYDTTEFEMLFTEKLDSSGKNIRDNTSRTGLLPTKKSKRHVQVIDSKRGMNGGIILARLKMDFKKLASLIDCMICGSLDFTQLKALKKFLPNDEETAGLKHYLNNIPRSKEENYEAINELCACEKYMSAMMDIPSVKEKFDCMLFETQFKPRLVEMMESINTLSKACDDVHTSNRLHKLIAMILTLGNQINTGGSGKVAAGFTLDALLKLDEAKAFDRKTSVLQYLVKLVKQNDEELLKFKKDMEYVEKAKGVVLGALSDEMKQMKEELEQVKVVAKSEGERKRGSKSSQKLTKKQEDSASDRENLLTEDLTPMEIFVGKAEKDVYEAFNKANDTNKKFISLLEYFGEDPKMPSSDFFGTLDKFVNAFEVSQGYVEKQEQARLKAEKRAAAEKAKGQKRKSPLEQGNHINISTRNVKVNVGDNNKYNNSTQGNNSSRMKPLVNPLLNGIAAEVVALTRGMNENIEENNESNFKSYEPIVISGIVGFAGKTSKKKANIFDMGIVTDFSN